MATKTPTRTWRGVVLATKKNETIVAGTYEAACRQMKKMHGPEMTGTKTNWVVGLASTK